MNSLIIPIDKIPQVKIPMIIENICQNWTRQHKVILYETNLISLISDFCKRNPPFTLREVC